MNVGESKTFHYSATPPTDGLRYVFEFWDGSVEVNTTGQVTKRLNMGGDPAHAAAPGQFTLLWSGTAVDERGNARGNSQRIVVNNPPVIVQSPQASVNDAVFPYSTELSLVAYDLEGHVPLDFNWYRNGTLVQTGQGDSVGNVPGIYRGASTGLSCAAYRSTLLCSGTNNITQPEVVKVDVVDSSSGTTTLNFSLLGRRPTNPYGSPLVETSSLIADATGTARQRTGLYQKARFVIHTEVLEDAPADVTWRFPQYAGWRALESGAGIAHTATVTRLASGAYELVAEKPLDNEHPLQSLNEAAREARVEVSFTHKGKLAQAVLSIILLPNNLPVMSDPPIIVTDKDGNSIDVSHGSANVSRSVGRLLFKASATDPDLDLVSFRWHITASDGSSVNVRGRVAVVDVSNMNVGTIIGGNSPGLVATDRFGATPSGDVSLPSITLTS